MKSTCTTAVLLGFCLISLSSCSTVPNENGTYNGKPVLTRASHPTGGSMHEVKGTYLGRRYFTPPGSKSGLQWIDVYGQ